MINMAHDNCKQGLDNSWDDNWNATATLDCPEISFTVILFYLIESMANHPNKLLIIGPIVIIKQGIDATESN